MVARTSVGLLSFLMNKQSLDKPVFEKPDFDTLELHFDEEKVLIIDDNARKFYEHINKVFNHWDEYLRWLHQTEIYDRFPTLSKVQCLALHAYLSTVFKAKDGQ